MAIAPHADEHVRAAAPARVGAALAGVGHAVPATVVANAEIAARLGVDEAWIESRTGTRERRTLADGERLTDLAVRAAGAALRDAGVAAADIDLVLVGTTSADEMSPPAAPLVAGALEVTHEAAAAAGVALDDIDLFVYHQANSRIIRAVATELGADPVRVVDVVDRFANTSAASIPIALSVAAGERRLRPGGTVLLAAFGAGLVWGGTVVTWRA
jgi:3-oxoacyl-[acyl-carrier-protein] synthase III